MVGFGRWGEAQHVPKAGHPVDGLAAEHALWAQVRGGVRDELEHENVGERRRAWWCGKPQSGGEFGVRVVRWFAQRAECAEHFWVSAHGSRASR